MRLSPHNANISRVTNPEVRSGGLLASTRGTTRQGSLPSVRALRAYQVGRPVPHAFPRRPVPRRGVERSMPHLETSRRPTPDVNALSKGVSAAFGLGVCPSLVQHLVALGVECACRSRALAVLFRQVASLLCRSVQGRCTSDHERVWYAATRSPPPRPAVGAMWRVVPMRSK